MFALLMLVDSPDYFYLAYELAKSFVNFPKYLKNH